MSALRDLPAEQLAPYEAPSERETERIREGIELHKRKRAQREATPPPVWLAHEPKEL